jgi:probable addiction module antidote protein
MALKTTRWDAAETLDTQDEVVAYLNAALEEGDPKLLKLVLGDIARSKGMTEIAKTANLGRSNLYKALSPEGNPEFATVASVLKALGLSLSVTRDRPVRRRAQPRRAAATDVRKPAVKSVGKPRSDNSKKERGKR